MNTARKQSLGYMPTFLQHFAWLPLRLFMVTFCSLKLEGVENIEKISGNVIIASNHSSELDPLFLVAALPFFSRHLPLIFVSREKSFYRDSALGLIYGGDFFRMMGAYPAYTGLNDYDKALAHHIEAAKQGKTICIFPIGKLHSLNDSESAKGGVIHLTQKTELPIVPVLIEGLKGYKTTDFLRGKCKLRITFGKPLYWNDIIEKTGSKDPENLHKQAAIGLMNHIANKRIT